MATSLKRGYTLVEIIIAMVVFAVGALGLAGGSAVVAREIGINGLRAAAGRLATSRREIVQSTCRTAQSGTETRGSIVSEWTVLRLDSNSIRLAGTVSYQTARGGRTETYSHDVGCR